MIIRMACIAGLLAIGQPTWADDVTLIGKASIPGTALDRSGLQGNMIAGSGKGTGIPQAQFGGAGSAIDYTGKDEVYRMASDRGPGNGDVRYFDRTHLVRIVVKPGQTPAVAVEIVATTLLTSPFGRHFTGWSGAFVGGPGYFEQESLRLDPEGVRCLPDGSFWLSDEYGPFILKFDAAGRQVDSFLLPAKYGCSHPDASADLELAANKLGRQPNRGMEGLAIMPDHNMLVGLMQNCLIQDHGLDDKMKRVSTYSRLITMNLSDKSTHEYVYAMDSEKMGLNELLAINDHQFLAIERDNKGETQAKAKHIVKLDLSGATDISKPLTADGKTYDYSGTTPDNGLPAAGAIPGVTVLQKTLLLDMLRPSDHLAGADLPEKMEGLAWGPDFPNGDKLLIVTSDNDFRTEQPTYFFAYRVTLTK